MGLLAAMPSVQLGSLWTTLQILCHPFCRYARLNMNGLQENSSSPYNSEPHNQPFLPICFDQPDKAFQARSTTQLAKSLAVFKACGIKALVNNGNWMLHRSKAIFGSALVDGIVKRTFFQHFCAGMAQTCVLPLHMSMMLTGLA